MTFSDKLAVVTGAASGIGRATAQALAREGAHVIVADIDAAGGEATAAALRDAGGKADFVQVDMTNLDSVNAFAATVQQKHGPVDVLVNGAGLGPHRAVRRRHAGVLGQGESR